MCLSYEDVARESCAMVPNKTVVHCNYVIPGTGSCRYPARTRALHGNPCMCLILAWVPGTYTAVVLAICIAL